MGDLRQGVARDEVGSKLAGFCPEILVSGLSVSESSGLRAPRPEVLGWGLIGDYGVEFLGSSIPAWSSGYFSKTAPLSVRKN